MDNQEFRNAYRAARIKHEDAHHSFPFDNCYMPECETAWEQMNRPVVSTITEPKKQLELLATHQQEFEILMQALTGLTVKVSLAVHPTNNSEADLLQLFEAAMLMRDFEAQSTANKTWISHKDFKRNISVFMPDGFDTDDLYSEPEDDEGYAQAVEVSHAVNTKMLNEALEDENQF